MKTECGECGKEYIDGVEHFCPDLSESATCTVREDPECDCLMTECGGIIDVWDKPRKEKGFSYCPNCTRLLCSE